MKGTGVKAGKKTYVSRNFLVLTGFKKCRYQIPDWVFRSYFRINAYVLLISS